MGVSKALADIAVSEFRIDVFIVTWKIVRSVIHSKFKLFLSNIISINKN